MQVLCFDIGGTDIKYGVVKDGKIVCKYSMKTDASTKESITKQLVDTTKKILEEYEIEGVGVSCAGCINYETGVVLLPSYSAPSMEGLELADIFKKNFGLECVADNDVNCFGLAESISGYGKSLNQFLMMTIGTGIGGAIVYYNQVWHGGAWCGGEFGKMLLGSDSQCFEEIASTAALVRKCKEAGLKVDNGVEIFKLYDNGDPLANKIVSQFFHDLAWGIANLVYIFDPEAIVIGGGISNRKSLSQEIYDEVAKIVEPETFKNIKIVNSKHGNDGGMIGAYYNYAMKNK